MPELHQLQTWISLPTDDFAPVLARCAGVLQELGIWNAEAQRAFADFHLTPDTDGRIYSSVDGLDYYPSPYFPAALRPHITVWNRASIPELTGIELELELLMETAALTVVERGHYHYRPGVQRAVQTLAHQLHAAFPQAGIYLTDEAQDGTDFDGLRLHDPARLWQFDYALLPAAVAARYPSPPDWLRVGWGPGYLEAWHASRWQ